MLSSHPPDTGTDCCQGMLNSKAHVHYGFVTRSKNKQYLVINSFSNMSEWKHLSTSNDICWDSSTAWKFSTTSESKTFKINLSQCHRKMKATCGQTPINPSSPFALLSGGIVWWRRTCTELAKFALCVDLLSVPFQTTGADKHLLIHQSTLAPSYRFVANDRQLYFKLPMCLELKERAISGCYGLAQTL